MRDGCGRDRFSVEMFSNSARNGTDGSRRLFHFFDDAVLLCFAGVETLCAFELLCSEDVFYTSVLHSIVFRN